MSHRVCVLVVDTPVLLDLAIASQLLSYDQAPYAVTICGERPGATYGLGGLRITVKAGPTALSEADTVIVPGFSPCLREPRGSTVSALARAHDRGCRMVSICTGAFALAAAGVLDGHSATTHWQYATALAERYPKVDVERNALYVDDGRVLTSAGVASGIDLCLHLIRKDHGVRVATAISRRVVAAPYRDGGQAQFIEQPLPMGTDLSLQATCNWALERLSQPLTIRQLAAHAAVSERTFARRFVAETGTTPLRWLTAQRLNVARELLEHGNAGVDEIAYRCGLGTADNLRMHFHRHLRTTPSAYRRTFS